MEAKKIDGDFDELMEFVRKRITNLTGNVFGERQMPMLEARLKRHLRDKGVTADEYPGYWRLHQQEEDDALVALLTTHFTSFFREFLHFEWLAEELPRLVSQAKASGRNEIRIWSSACSRGQEVWSLSMWMMHHMPKIAPEFKWSILGTDIDGASVKVAINGVYHHRELETAPRHLWEPYWQRGTGEIREWLKVKNVLRGHCSFATDNLLSLNLASSQKFDVIFCRNVLIYFDHQNQIKTVKNLLSHLHEGGALITGVSESLVNLNLGLVSLAPSVYSVERPIEKKQEFVSSKKTIPKPLRVLCVDDSSTVLNIMKKLLSTSEFEIVATASNGQEALSKIEQFRPDVITLDLHMPVMDGFTLVREHGVAKKLPVVVVSTVERDNSSLVQPLFSDGVCDFLEKPSFDNLSRIGEELQQKLKMAWWAKKRGEMLPVVQSSELNVRNKRTAGRVVLNAGLTDRNVVEWVLKNAKIQNDQVVILMSGQRHLWEEWGLQLKSDCSGLDLVFQDQPDWVRDARPTVFLQFISGDMKHLNYARSQNANIILEDAEWPDSIKNLAQDCYPASSFVYMVDKILEGK